MAQQAVGYLEVYGCVAALVAADAAAKAGNVTIDPLDKNKPAKADDLPVPLIICLKIRGPVADVQCALDAAEMAAKSVTGVITKHFNPSADPETEKMVRRESVELKKNIHHYYYDSGRNLYHSFLNPDGTQSEWQHLHTQYLMLSLDIVPRDLKDKVYQACRQQNTPFTFSPLLYMMWVMAEISPESRRYAREYIDAQYSAMLRQGATTFWEVDEGEKAFASAGSLCHAWSSIHAWYYGRMTLGINPLEPGFRRFELRIDPGDFCEAEGDIPTPHGLIHVAWTRQDNGSLILKIRYPQQLKAVFRAYEEAPYEKITEEKY